MNIIQSASSLGVEESAVVSPSVYPAILFAVGSLQPITADIQVAVLSSGNPSMFNLICTSTGGPATNVTWTRDGNTVPYNNNHVLTQTVEDAGTVEYSNTLTVTGVEGGPYRCVVSNARGTVMSPVLTGTGKSIVIDPQNTIIIKPISLLTVFLSALLSNWCNCIWCN